MSDTQNCDPSAPRVIGRPFQPGHDQRRNLGGRPKSKPITEQLLKELKRKPHNGKLTNLELGIKNLVGVFVHGTGSEAVAAYKAISGYVEGLPTQPVEIDVPGLIADAAARYGADPDKVVSIYERLKRTG